MAIEKKPRPPRPKGIVPPYSLSHPVKNGDSWASLAQRYGIPEREIIYANFGTLVPEEVNWYLRHYVGCTKETRDGKNLMFSSSAKPGIIYIPPRKFSFDPETIVGTLPPRYFTVSESPATWSPPPLPDDGASARIVVTRDPWTRESLKFGGIDVRTRKQWGAKEPSWQNEVIYYNTFRASLDTTLKTIIVHHTDNTDSIAAVEEKQKSKGYAALGYQFFVEQAGSILEGRPLEVMGSNAGEGDASGPTNDPDWGAIGIVLQGDYEGFPWSDPPQKQLDSLETLIIALRNQFPIERLLMHREVRRKGDVTVCPGQRLVPHIESLRKKLGMPGP